MKHAAFIAAVVLAVLLAGGFTAVTLRGAGIREGEEGRLTVAATIYPLYDIARTVAGDRARAVLLLPPGASPETFELSPGAARELQRSAILFAVGHGIDEWALDAAQNAAPVIVDRGVALRMLDEDEEDPHYWLDPANARVIARTMADALSDANPDGAESYRNNAARLQEDLEVLEREMREGAPELRGLPVIAAHDAWGYFAEVVGLEIAGSVHESPGKDPGPRTLRALQEAAAARNVRLMIAEPQLASPVLEAFAEDRRMRIVSLDPIGGTGEMKTYASMIRQNIERLRNAARALEEL